MLNSTVKKIKNQLTFGKVKGKSIHYTSPFLTHSVDSESLLVLTLSS